MRRGSLAPHFQRGSVSGAKSVAGLSPHPSTQEAVWVLPHICRGGAPGAQKEVGPRSTPVLHCRRSAWNRTQSPTENNIQNFRDQWGSHVSYQEPEKSLYEWKMTTKRWQHKRTQVLELSDRLYNIHHKNTATTTNSPETHFPMLVNLVFIFLGERSFQIVSYTTFSFCCWAAKVLYILDTRHLSDRYMIFNYFPPFFKLFFSFLITSFDAWKF